MSGLCFCIPSIQQSEDLCADPRHALLVGGDGEVRTCAVEALPILKHRLNVGERPVFTQQGQVGSLGDPRADGFRRCGEKDDRSHGTKQPSVVRTQNDAAAAGNHGAGFPLQFR